jgi:hypothetical protein
MNCHTVESAAMRLIHVLVEMMNTFVVVPWRMCSASPCSWWCLCCNRWLCWIALILVAIITFVFWLLYLILIITLLTSCETLCVLLAMFNQAEGRCFGNGNPDPGAGPLPTPVPPTPPVNPEPPTKPE